MSVLKTAIASTNFATATTWSDAWATGQQVAGASTTALTTSFQYSTAVTGDGSAVRYSWFKVSARPASPGAETVTFELNVNAIAVATVTINKSDIPTDANCWICIDWGGSQTLTNTKAVKVGIKTSATTSGATNFFRDATVANWNTAYILNAASAAVPTTGDTIMVCGPRTGAGAQTAITVTMNQNSATAISDIHVSDGGTLTWTTSATTLLTTSGNFTVYASGTHNMGTSGTPIAAANTATLDFTGASKAYTINAGGTDNRYGASLTRVYDLVASTANSAQAVIVTANNNSADWNQWGKLIAVAGTSRSARQSEELTISSIATTSITCTGNLTNTHNSSNTGGFDMRPHVVHLSRNNIMRANAGTALTLSFGTTATVNWQYTEQTALSSGTIANGTISTTTGSLSIQYSSWHDAPLTSTSIALNVGGGVTNNITLAHNVCYNLVNATSNGIFIQNTATSGTSYTINDCIAIRVSASASISTFNMSDIGGTITNLVVNDSASTSTSGAPFLFNETGTTVGTCSGHEVYCSAGNAITANTTFAPGGTLSQRNTISSCNFWYNNVSGFELAIYHSSVLFSSCKAWGNVSEIGIPGNGSCDGVAFLNCTFDQSSGTVSTQAISVTGASYLNASFIGCTFGGTNTYTTLITSSSSAGVFYLNAFGSTFTATNVWSGTQSRTGFLESFDDGGVTGAYKLWGSLGVTTSTAMEASDTTHGEHTTCRALNPNIASNSTGNNCQHWLEGIPYISGTAPIPTFRLKSFGSWDGKAYISIFFKGQILQGPTEITSSINSSTFTNCSITGATPSESMYYDALLEYSGTQGGLYLDAEGDAALQTIS